MTFPSLNLDQKQLFEPVFIAGWMTPYWKNVNCERKQLAKESRIRHSTDLYITGNISRRALILNTNESKNMTPKWNSWNSNVATLSKKTYLKPLNLHCPTSYFTEIIWQFMNPFQTKNSFQRFNFIHISVSLKNGNWLYHTWTKRFRRVFRLVFTCQRKFWPFTPIRRIKQNSCTTIRLKAVQWREMIILKNHTEYIQDSDGYKMRELRVLFQKQQKRVWKKPKTSSY